MKGEIKFLSGGVEGVEVLRLSKEGIWANPDVPVDKAAGYVLEALDSYVKKLVNEAVKAEREACALIADEEFGSTLMIGDAQPKHSSAWRIAAAIRARGEP
jgi:hypothetical protein